MMAKERWFGPIRLGDCETLSLIEVRLGERQNIPGRGAESPKYIGHRWEGFPQKEGLVRLPRLFRPFSSFKA